MAALGCSYIVYCVRMNTPSQVRVLCVQDLKKTKFRQVLQWGRYAYRGATMTYSAFMVYQNPWLVRAVVSALWSAGTVVCAML